MESPGWANQASSYSAEQTRRAVFSPYARTAANAPGILAGGLLSASDLNLSAPGSGLSVNISTGEAIVGGSEGGVQGGYYARNASTTNLTISTANPTNPRIDTVCVTIADNGYTEPTGVSGNAAVLQVVTGTPTAGATLSNLNGKAALPLSSLLLGYVLVPAAASNIITADISNRATTVGLGGFSAAAPATAYVSSSAQTLTGSWVVLNVPTLDFDPTGAMFNNGSSYVYKVPAAGYYHVDVSMSQTVSSGGTSNVNVGIGIGSSSSGTATPATGFAPGGTVHPGSSNSVTVSFSKVVSVSASQYINISANNAGGNTGSYLFGSLSVCRVF